MRKNDLIKLLETLEGNPEVALWNGYVGDYNHISSTLDTLELVKETREFILSSLIHQHKAMEGLAFDAELPQEEIQRLSDLATILHKERSWDTPNPYVSPEEYESWYGKRVRKIVVLSPKERGKVSLGMTSAGDIPY